jgi:hypothetical protein
MKLTKYPNCKKSQLNGKAKKNICEFSLELSEGKVLFIPTLQREKLMLGSVFILQTQNQTTFIDYIYRVFVRKIIIRNKSMMLKLFISIFAQILL